jgi:hypothetical protein
MDNNIAPRSDDNSPAMKIARWAVWGIVAILMVWFIVQLPVFHLSGQ